MRTYIQVRILLQRSDFGRRRRGRITAGDDITAKGLHRRAIDDAHARRTAINPVVRNHGVIASSIDQEADCRIGKQQVIVQFQMAGAAPPHGDAGGAVIGDNIVMHRDLKLRGAVDIDAGDEIADGIAGDQHGPRVKNTDAGQSRKSARSSAFDIQSFQDDSIRGGGIDGDAMGARCQDTGLKMIRPDRDRLSDGHRAIGTGIEGVDLSTRSRLGNRSGKGFTRRGARAGIGIVTDPRNPCPRRLGKGRACPRDLQNSQCERHTYQDFAHNSPQATGKIEHSLDLPD